MIFLRALLFSIPRHLLMLISVVAVDAFDFHPLPARTATYVAFFFQFLITWFFAEWTFWHRLPRFRETLMVFFTFLIVGSLLEITVITLFLPVSWWNVFRDIFHWNRLYLVAIFFLAVSLAAFHVRRCHVKAKLPEGLES